MHFWFYFSCRTMAWKRTFRDAAFQPWLARFDGDPTRAFCKTCKRDVAANKTAIVRHKESQLHVANGERGQQDGNAPQQEEHPGHSTSRGIAFATIHFCCFISENNLPFSTTADTLIDLMKVMFPDSAIARGLSFKKTKCTELVKGLAKTVTGTLVHKLRTNQFSLIIHESTDISTEKCCALVARFYDSATQTIETRFFSK